MLWPFLKYIILLRCWFSNLFSACKPNLNRIGIQTNWFCYLLAHGMSAVPSQNWRGYLFCFAFQDDTRNLKVYAEPSLWVIRLPEEKMHRKIGTQRQKVSQLHPLDGPVFTWDIQCFHVRWAVIRPNYQYWKSFESLKSLLRDCYQLLMLLKDFPENHERSHVYENDEGSGYSHSPASEFNGCPHMSLLMLVAQKLRLNEKNILTMTSIVLHHWKWNFVEWINNNFFEELIIRNRGIYNAIVYHRKTHLMCKSIIDRKTFIWCYEFHMQEAENSIKEKKH